LVVVPGGGFRRPGADPALNQLEDIDAEHAHRLPIRRSDECPFPLGAGTEKHGPNFRSTPHREAWEIGGEGFGYRFPVLETPPCGWAPDEDQNTQSSVHEAMIPSRSWAFHAGEHGLALGVPAILQLPRIRRMPA
jgi:hypothetical protein